MPTYLPAQHENQQHSTVLAVSHCSGVKWAPHAGLTAFEVGSSCGIGHPALKVQQPLDGATPKRAVLPLFQWLFHDERG